MKNKKKQNKPYICIYLYISKECWDDYCIIAAPSVVTGLRHVDDLKARAETHLEQYNIV